MLDLDFSFFIFVLFCSFMLDWQKSKEKQYVLQSDLAQVRMKNVCRGYFCGKKSRTPFLKKRNIMKTTV